MWINRGPLMGLLLSLAVTAQGSDAQAIYSTGGANPAVLPCLACHGLGAEGIPLMESPRLAGLSAGYMRKQLADFASGARANVLMQPIAAALTDAEIDAVTTMLAAKKSPQFEMVSRTDPATSVGARLALRGAWERNIPECVACHAPGGIGVGDAFPPLVGQSEQYLVAQLNAWRGGTRKNDPNDLMGHIARSLSDDEVSLVSEYFAGLSAEGASQ